MVNFDMIQNKTLRLMHSVDRNTESEAFKVKMESEFPELFKGIGSMDGEISIKLTRGSNSLC